MIEDTGISVEETSVGGSLGSLASMADDAADVDAGAEPTATSTEVSLETDPATLPTEVQDLAKRLQADYTKKTQELSQEREYAAAFKRFVADPVYRKQLLAELGQAAPTAGESTQELATNDAEFPWAKVKPNELFQDESVLGIQAAAQPVVQAVLKQVLGPILPQWEKYKGLLDQVLPFIEELQSSRATSEWDTLAKQYNAAAHKDAVMQFRSKNPGLTLEQALLAVAGKDLMAPRRNPQGQSGDKRQVGLFNGSKTPATAAQGQGGKRGSLADALSAHLR